MANPTCWNVILTWYTPPEPALAWAWAESAQDCLQVIADGENMELEDLEELVIFGPFLGFGCVEGQSYGFQRAGG